MSILFGKPAVEQRSISFQDVWGSGGSATRGVNPLSIVPVYSATGLIADQFASSPCAVFDKTDSGVPTRAKVQPQLVRDPGVNGLDIYSWKHQAISSALLRGNAYGYILNRDRDGVPSTVVWLNPNDVDVDESGAVPVFTFKGNVIPRARLIHIPAYVQAGSVVGLSPLALFKAQIETADAAQV
jgi:phage portal protein BeeE